MSPCNSAVPRKLPGEAMESFVLSGRICNVSANIGIAIFPEDGRDAQSLLKNAGSAMYFAKQDGKNSFQYCSGSVPPSDRCLTGGQSGAASDSIF
jgi:predicted signal transduction protein with EAL and GGDEF domain